MNEQNPTQRLTDELEHDLTARYGVMLGSNALWRELGFRSPAAFRVALSRGMIGVPFFTLPNRRGRFALAKDIANTAISVAAAPVHGAGVISGVVTALAKLLIRIASYVAEYKSIQKANLYLDYIDYKPMDRNPVALFKASPVLGAIYLNRVSTSDLLPFSDVGGVRKPSFFNRNPKQMSLQTMQQVEIERLARKLDPLRTKSRKVEADSPLHLVTKGEAMTTAADEMKDVLKDAAKDQFKDFAKGAVGMSSD